jgi:hypothetical protein
MPVSADIYGRIEQPKQGNLLRDYANVIGIQHGQQQNELGRMQMDAARQATEQQNTLADVIRGAMGADGKIDRNAALSGTAQRVPGQYFDLQKRFAEQDKAGADVNKSNTETKVKELEAATKRIDLAGQAFNYVRQNPTPENAMAVLDHLGQNGVYTPEQVAQYKAKIQAAPDQVGQMADMAFRAALSAKDQLAKVSTQNLGGTSQQLSVDPVSGASKVLRTDAITQSADNLASNQQSDRNNQRSVGAQYDIAKSNRYAADTAAGAARDVAKTKRTQDVEMKLADDYRTESKGWAETSTSMKKILAALKTATTNAGSALAAGTGFMKILDPNSVVRESELGMALNASGWFDRATNIAQQMQSGKIMTPTQVKNLSAAANALYEEAKAAQLEVDKAYETRANSYGADPKNVITDRGQNRRATDGKPSVDMSAIDAEIARRKGGK